MNDLINDLVLWAGAVDWLRFWITVAVVVLPLVLVILITLFASERTVVIAARLYRQARPYMDEPGDPLVKLLAERTGLPPERVIDLVTRNLDGVLLVVSTPQHPAGAETGKAAGEAVH